MIRLFAKDTGGVTKFCMIDTAGTVTQFGSGGGGASLALDNLDTVAINTSLVSDTTNTDDLGSAASYWKALYVHTAFVTNLSVAGTATFTGNVAFDSSVIISGTLTTHNAITANQIVRINDALIVSSNTTLRSTLSVEGSISASAQTFTCGWVEATANLTVHGQSTLCAAVTMGSTCDIDGDLAVSGDFTCEGHASFGVAQVPAATEIISVFEDKTDTGTLYGMYMDHSYTPSVAGSDALVGIGGFAIVGNTNKRGATTGLSFGPYNAILTTTGSTAVSTTLIGIQTFGARGYNGTMKATEITGLNVRGCLDDGAMTSFNASSVTTILCKANPTSLTTPAEYGIRMEELTRGTTTRVQMQLMGSSSAGDSNDGHGIWFGGTTTADGVHIGRQEVNGGLFISNMHTYASGDDAIAWETATRTLVNNASTRELKDNIRPFKDDWMELLNMEMKEWEEKSDGKTGRGWVAEELEPYVPELVKWSAKTGKVKGIKTFHLPMYLLEIIKIQQGQITKLEERLDGLERRENRTS
jgi:hypothetical protein